MSRQLFRHRKLTIDVQLDDCLTDEALAERIRWLAARDDWFRTFTRGAVQFPQPKEGAKNEVRS